MSESIDPLRCLSIHAIDGYEAYKIDDNTIGVRPIWYDVEKFPPPSMIDLLLCVEGKVILGWNESVQTNEEPSFCCWHEWPDQFLYGDGVSHWMHLPKPLQPEKDS